VLAPTLWRFADIAAHWDECRMTSHVGGKLYQDCSVAAFLRPEDMLRILSERTLSLPKRDFMVFCGTIASLDKTMGFGADWAFEMTDPVLGRSIRHAYRVINLMDEIKPGFRVPVSSIDL
jgi:4-hydroxyphenylacetate 3-monooxygenase